MGRNTDLCAKILYIKYGDNYPWLSFKDLKRIILKFNSDPLNDIEKKDINANTIKNIHSKIIPIIEKIQQVKSIRVFEENAPEHTQPLNTLQNDITTPTDIVPTLSYKNYSVLIDSKDRDKDRWANHNPFQFTLGPSSISQFQFRKTSNIETDYVVSSEQLNSISRKFSDVYAVTIKKIIVPNISHEYPYLLLNINELGSNISGTNNTMNNAYGYLTTPSSVGNYHYYEFNDNFEAIAQMGQHSHMTKVFSPRIEISRLTFLITSPDGTVIEYNNDDASIIIELQITCLRRDLENNIIYKTA